MGGHYAVRGTLLKLSGIAWPEIQVDVELLVCTCELCLRNKHVAHLDVKAHYRPSPSTSTCIWTTSSRHNRCKGGEQVIIQAVHSARKLIQSKALLDRSAKIATHWFYSEW